MAELRQFDELVEKEMQQTLLTIASLPQSTPKPRNASGKHRSKFGPRIQKELFRFDPTLRIAGETALRKLPHHRYRFIKGDRPFHLKVGLGLDDARLQAVLYDPTATDTSISLSSDDDDHSIAVHSQSHQESNSDGEHNNALLTEEKGPAVDLSSTNISNSTIMSTPPNYPKPSVLFKSPSRKILPKQQ